MLSAAAGAVCVGVLRLREEDAGQDHGQGLRLRGAALLFPYDACGVMSISQILWSTIPCSGVCFTSAVGLDCFCCLFTHLLVTLIPQPTGALDDDPPFVRHEI